MFLWKKKNCFLLYSFSQMTKTISKEKWTKVNYSSLSYSVFCKPQSIISFLFFKVTKLKTALTKQLKLKATPSKKQQLMTRCLIALSHGMNSGHWLSAYTHTHARAHAYICGCKDKCVQQHRSGHRSALLRSRPPAEKAITTTTTTTTTVRLITVMVCGGVCEAWEWEQNQQRWLMISVLLMRVLRPSNKPWPVCHNLAAEILQTEQPLRPLCLSEKAARYIKWRGEVHWNTPTQTSHEITMMSKDDNREAEGTIWSNTINANYLPYDQQKAE